MWLGDQATTDRGCLTWQVPRSSKLIFEDNDYSLFSVTLFKRVADSFKAAARSKGFQVIDIHDGDSHHSDVLQSLQDNLLNAVLITDCLIQVRDYEFNQELQENQSEAAKSLKANADSKRSQLEQWSALAYGEVWMDAVTIPQLRLVHFMTTVQGCATELQLVMLLSDDVAGVQCLDSHLCNPAVCGEHSQIWPAAQILGCAVKTEPEEYNKAAETSCVPLWLSWCAHLILQHEHDFRCRCPRLSPSSECFFQVVLHVLMQGRASTLTMTLVQPEE